VKEVGDCIVVCIYIHNFLGKGWAKKQQRTYSDLAIYFGHVRLLI
jgi:hypothetical protein